MTSGHDEDSAWMLRAQRGDLEAFELLVEKYRQPVCHFVFRTLHDPVEAEDIAQQVFLQAWKAAPRYRIASRFSTWLFTIARNLCLNELRRRGRHPAESLDASPHPGDPPSDLLPTERDPPGVTESVLLGELESKIAEALQRLPENQRTAVLLFRDTELAYEDIAAVLGVSVSATKSLIFRARESLKLWLKPYLRSGSWEPSPTPSPPSPSPPTETFPKPRF